MYPDEKKLFVEIQKVSSKIVYLCGQKKNKMAEHNELGKEGEDEAAHYLTERGYHILHRNWRRGRNELDIVAAKIISWLSWKSRPEEMKYTVIPKTP